jgi:hypothetical protein
VPGMSRSSTFWVATWLVCSLFIWSAPVQASHSRATVGEFAGHWYGNERNLTISSSGKGTEYLVEAAQLAERFSLQLSHPSGVESDATVKGSVTSVHVYKPDGRNVRVGETVTLQLQHGMIAESFHARGLNGTVNFCDTATADAGDCGA